jgi:PEGA domain
MNSISALRRLRGPIAIAMVVVFTASTAAAQGPAPALAPAEATSEARTHFDRGVAFYDESDYAAALVEFKRAYALAPTWQVLFNIGQAYFQIRNYSLALVTLTRFLEEGHDRIPEARRATVESERADLANRVGHANIESNRPGATVTIDDEEVGVTPLAGPALVSVGLRKVKAVAPGNQPVEEEVSVSAGDTVDVRLDFPEDSPPPAPPPAAAFTPRPAEPGAPARSPSTSRAPAIAVFGVALAGAAVGAVFGVMALRDKSRLEGECTGKACNPGSQPDINAVARDGSISTIAFGATAVAVVVSVVLWATSSGRGRSASAAWTPAVGPVRLGPGLVGGSF